VLFSGGFCRWAENRKVFRDCLVNALKV
jgi:hypothetical protein